MSISTQIISYWTNNSTLNTALPVTQVQVGMQNPTVVRPNCVLSIISDKPIYNTGEDMVRRGAFQFTLRNESLAALETLADTVNSQFETQTITDDGMICLLDSRFNQCENLAGSYVYSVILSYIWLRNSVVGSS